MLNENILVMFSSKAISNSKSLLSNPIDNTDDVGNEEQEKKRTVLSRIPGFRTTTGNMASLRMPL